MAVFSIAYGERGTEGGTYQGNALHFFVAVLKFGAR
jgi:hypothetical protein